MVTDFSTEDKASCVKFCTVVIRRPGQGISHFGELCSPEAQNRTNPIMYSLATSRRQHDWHTLRKSDHSCLPDTVRVLADESSGQYAWLVHWPIRPAH